jgi:hypothetical protein
MVIVPGHINYSFLSCLTQQFALFLALRVLPRVFNNKRYLSVPLTVYFLVSSRLTGDIWYMLYEFVKDKTLGLIITHDFNILFAVRC